MNAHARNVHITSEYITLGQLLKFTNIISSGYEAKYYLANNEVYVNGELDCRRGRKLRVGDEIKFKEGVIKII